MNYANVLASTANFALSSYVSPRYSRAAARGARAPGQPVPGAFQIWLPIFAGQIAYGFLPEEERSSEASLASLAIQAAGFGYAWALTSQRYYTMGGAMAFMTAATAAYRASLPAPQSAAGKAVSFTAEMGVGWLLAADMVVAAQNTRRVLHRPLKHREQDAIGAVEALAVTAGAIGANRLLGWRGVSVAAAWALGGIAVDSRSEKHVRTLAGVAAVGVLADLALSVWGSRSSDDREIASDLLAGDQEEGIDGDVAVLVEETYIPPGLLVEEITTVRI